VRNLLWKSSCELTTVGKLEVIWLWQLPTVHSVENVCNVSKAMRDNLYAITMICIWVDCWRVADGPCAW
jgi:hypothetical protein